MSLNKAMIIGNVGKDPEVRYLDGPERQKVATFSVATTEKYRDRGGNQRESTEWHNIVAWRAAADFVENYVKRGMQIYVEGRLRTRSWTDKSGNTRSQTEIMADNLQLLGKRQENPGQHPEASAQQPAAKTAPKPVQPIADDDDLPF